MHKRLAILSALLCIAPHVCAQERFNPSPVALAAGRATSLGFLTALTNPGRTKYRIGIVVDSGCYGMLVSAKDAPAALDYVVGTDDSICVQAVRQIDGPGTNAEPGFRVTRKTLTSVNCPRLAAALTAFHAALEAESTPIPLAGPLPVDETDWESGLMQFRVQVAAANGRVLSVRAPPASASPLHYALGQLDVTVRDCSRGNVESVEERHSFDGEAVRPENAGQRSK